VPGGKPIALFLSCVGFTTAWLTIALSFVPSPEQRNPALAVVKVAGGTGILLAIGALLYWTGERRFQKTAAHL
jgi:hypothetical protein